MPSPSISVHQFQFALNSSAVSSALAPSRCFVQVVRYSSLLQLWIGSRDAKSDNLAVAFPLPRGNDASNSQPEVAATKILGHLGQDDISENLSNKLSQKLGKPVYVSYNHAEDTETWLEILKYLLGEIRRQPELF